MSVDRYRGKKTSSIRQTVWPVQSWQTHTHTDIHTAKKLRKVYFTFLLCFFYILLGSKIGGFQKRLLSYNGKSVLNQHNISHRITFFLYIFSWWRNSDKSSISIPVSWTWWHPGGRCRSRSRPPPCRRTPSSPPAAAPPGPPAAGWPPHSWHSGSSWGRIYYSVSNRSIV